MRYLIGPFILSIAILSFLILFAEYTKPECPEKSIAVHTRNGWYCTVEPLK